jgi:hypothetical protein
MQNEEKPSIAATRTQQYAEREAQGLTKLCAEHASPIFIASYG